MHVSLEHSGKKAATGFTVIRGVPKVEERRFSTFMNAQTRTEPSLRDSRLFTKHLADYVLPTIPDDEYITFAIPKGN